MGKQSVLGTKHREGRPVAGSPGMPFKSGAVTAQLLKLSAGGNCLLSVSQFSDLKQWLSPQEIRLLWNFPLKKLHGPGKALESPVSHQLLEYVTLAEFKASSSSRRKPQDHCDSSAEAFAQVLNM